MESRSWRFHLTSLLPYSLIQGLIGFASLAIYSRILTPAEYGTYVLAISMQFLLQWTLFGWLLMSVTRFMPTMQATSSAGIFLKTIYALAVGMVLIGLFMLPLLNSPFIANTIGYGQGIAMMTLTATLARGLALIGVEAHRSSLRILRYTLMETGQALLSLVIGYGLISHYNGGASAILFAITIANLALLLVDSSWIHNQIYGHRFSKEYLATISGFGWPMTLTVILRMGLMNLDCFIVASLMGHEAVAMYGAASSIADRPISMMFFWVGSALISHSVHILQYQGVEATRCLLGQTLQTLIVMTLPMMVGLGVLAVPVAQLMLGQGFHAEVPPLLALVSLVALMKGFVDHYWSQYFQLMKSPRRLSMIYATTLLVNILSNLWLIQKLGVMGAPLSALISYTTAFAFQLWFIDPQFAPRAPWADISKALVACGVMGFVVASLELPAGITGLAMGIAVGVLTYGLLAYALDLAGVRRMVSRHRLVV